MNTYQLKRGILRMEGDRIYIPGGQAKFVRILIFIGALCWSVFFSLQAQKHYKTYLLTQHWTQLLFMVLLALMVLFWLYIGYTRGLQGAEHDEIHVRQIVKAQKKSGTTDNAPVVTLFLKDNRKKILEFDHAHDLHFADSLAGRGVPVVEH